MKTTLKTAIALVLAIAFILPLIACSGDTPDVGETDSTPNTVEDASLALSPSPTPPPPGDTDDGVTFSDVEVYDNYITATVTGGAEGDWYDYYLSTDGDTLWSSRINEQYSSDSTVTFYPLKADTTYFIGVVIYRFSGNTDSSGETVGSSNARTTTRKLLNLQRCEIYDRTRTLEPDHTTIPENTSDTVYFKARFFPNPDYLARFDVNNDGVVNDDDRTALLSAIDGEYSITEPETTYQYTWIGTGETDTFTVRRGDINKDWQLTSDDAERFESILKAPDDGAIRFYLLTKSDYDAYAADIETVMDLDEYILQTKTIPIIQILTQETVVDESFSGLASGTEYVILAYGLPQKHYGAPWDMHSLVARTLP